MAIKINNHQMKDFPRPRCWQIYHGLDCQSGVCEDVVEWDGDWGGINWTPEPLRWFFGKCGEGNNSENVT